MIWVLATCVLAAAAAGVFLAAYKQRSRNGPSDRCRLGWMDGLLIAVLCILFGAAAFTGLGDREAPETVYDIAENSVKLEFSTPIAVEGIWLYPCTNEINGASDIVITYTENGQSAERRIDSYGVFAWRYVSIGKTVSELTVSADCRTLTLGELGVLGENGLVSIGSDFELFDEQHLIPERSTYKNSAYFDEIYHARTAYEFINGIPAYEWTHPPLGKAILSLGIRVFGMNPFGWRFMSALAGCAMVAAVYLFARRMLGKRAPAFLAALLMSCDFMHLVQSRIGTVDGFLVLFMLLMYFFMYRFFMEGTEKENERIPWIPLLGAALCFGLAVSVKWSAAYGIFALFGIGLFTALHPHYPVRGRERGRHIAAAVGLFITVPLAVYLLSYIPFTSPDGSQGLAAIVNNQRDILAYHGNAVLGEEHAEASRWYTWPLNRTPVTYYTAHYSESVIATIKTMGNPVIWLGGLAALAANGFLAVREKDKNAVFLLAVWASSYLPWMFVARDTFIYHYYPCVALMILMAANALTRLYPKRRKTAIGLSVGYAAAALTAFVIFLPVLTGQPLEADALVNRFLLA